MLSGKFFVCLVTDFLNEKIILYLTSQKEWIPIREKLETELATVPYIGGRSQMATCFSVNKVSMIA